MRRLLTLLLALTLAPGCLVISLNPAYDGETIGWDPTLLGHWEDTEDRSSLDIERGEWKSYRLKYVHPSESGTLTAYLTSIGDERFLDVMPARGADHGSFLIPAHALFRVNLDGDRLELTPLSYDRLSEHLRSRTPLPGLDVRSEGKRRYRLRHAGAPNVAPQTAKRGRHFWRWCGICENGVEALMLKGTKPAVVKKIQPVSIHGQISLDVLFVDPDDLDGQVSLARVGPESVPRALEPGDAVDLHYMLGVVTQITRRG
jgi:hypothetical protein